MHRLFTTAIALLGLLTLSRFPALAQVPDRSADVVADILSDERTVRALARDQLTRERERTIKRLVDSIEEKVQFSAKVDSVRNAMMVLADMHAVESIDVLIRHIGYPTTAEIDDGLIGRPFFAWVDNTPSVAALVKIGPSCIDPVISKLKTTDREVEHLALVSVLRQLDTPFMRERLVLATEKADGSAKTNLTNALKMYDEWIPPAERKKRLFDRLEQMLPALRADK